MCLQTDIAIGVDGCPGGWVAAIWHPDDLLLTIRVANSLSDLILAFPDVAIGIDIPIGLAETDPRGCDMAARRLLGPGRASSVFPAPCRGIVHLGASYAVSSARSRELTKRGISQQAYHIIPKIAEADAALDPVLQHRVFEVHPEVSFWALAGGKSMVHAKKKTAGFEERRDYLRRVFPSSIIPETRRTAISLAIESKQLGRGAGADDVLDAIVAAWSAHRFATGLAQRIPEQIERDERGLLMQIVY